jgi:hypothetical protein
MQKIIFLAIFVPLPIALTITIVSNTIVIPVKADKDCSFGKGLNAFYPIPK